MKLDKSEEELLLWGEFIMLIEETNKIERKYGYAPYSF